MTTTPIRFNPAAAADALARSDEGVTALPGDAALIAAYEGYCQQEYERYEMAAWAEQNARELADWLATQCGGCEPGGTGEDCDEHFPAVDAVELAA